MSGIRGLPPAAVVRDLAIRLADRADALALGAFGGPISVARKPDGTPVTEIDRAVERELREIIAREHPGAGVLGEEFPETPGDVRWVIDPIDGTALYVAGDPRFAVLIALEAGSRVVAGVVSAPALGERWWAVEDLGAFHSVGGSTEPAVVSATEAVEGASMLLIGGTGFARRRVPGVPDPAAALDGLLAAGALPERLDVSWEAVRVADGRYDLAVTSGNWWDVAPLSVIVTEAGGTAAIHPGGDGRFAVSLANGALGATLAAALAAPG